MYSHLMYRFAAVRLAAFVFCAVLALPFVALAQPDTVTPQTPAGDLMIAVYVAIAGVIGVAATALLLWLKSKGGAHFRVLTELWILAQAVVAHVEAKIRPTITRALADGKLSPEERVTIQKEALEAFKEAMPDQLKKRALAIFGEGGLSVILSGLLEWALKRFKMGAPPTTVLPAGAAAHP